MSIPHRCVLSRSAAICASTRADRLLGYPNGERLLHSSNQINFYASVLPNCATLPARRAVHAIEEHLPVSAPVMALAAIPALRAQDTRNVTEPRFPQACVVLTARISADKGVLSDAGERTPDTARIQDAIDHCEQGRPSS